MKRPSLVSPAGVPIVRVDVPADAVAHHVMMTFPDDHDINGAKVSIIGVTPEQIAVAIMYLGRALDRMMDAAEIMAMRAADDAAAAAERDN